MKNQNKKFEDIYEVMQAHPIWFSPDTMEFFASKVESELIDGMYFVSSEKTGFRETRRAFSVRSATEDGIHTVGGFQRFKTKRSALSYIDGLVESAEVQ